MDDAEAVEPDECTRNAGQHHQGIRRAGHAVRPQRMAGILHDEVELSTLTEGSVRLDDVGMWPS